MEKSKNTQEKHKKINENTNRYTKNKRKNCGVYVDNFCCQPTYYPHISKSCAHTYVYNRKPLKKNNFQNVTKSWLYIKIKSQNAERYFCKSEKM